MVSPGIPQQLAQIVGPDHVSVEAADRELATADIFEWPDRKPALAVVRPANHDEVARIVALSRQNAIAMVPRGAGLSYTGGMAVTRDAVVVDISRIDAIAVDEASMTATIGAGASWENVAAVLKPLNLRSRQPSPISGAFSTVGGLASQGLPAGTDGILALTVVLPDGTTIRTGAASMPVRAVPDMTSLFLGDGGAFGIKTEIVLRLERIPAAGFATFEFDDAKAMLESLALCTSEGLISRAFAMDRAKAGQAKAVDTGDAATAAAAVLRESGSLLGAAKSAAKLVGFALSRGNSLAWSLHLTIEAPTSEGVDAQLRKVREICGRQGKEAPDVFPRTLHAKPYSVRGFVGPNGERWVPVHGIFKHANGADALAAIQAYLESRAADMSAHGITASYLVSSSAPYVLIEPMLYWSDRLDPIHMKYLSPRNRERFGAFADNPAARALVRELREGMRTTMDQSGAIHCQLGRFYRPEQQFDAPALALLRQFKRMIDPGGLMNPGVLGFDAGKDQ